jgi:hypothetical protein
MARPLAGPPSVMVDPPWHRGTGIAGIVPGAKFSPGQGSGCRPGTSGAGHPQTPDAGGRGNPRPAYIPRTRRGVAGTPPQPARHYPRGRAGQVENSRPGKLPKTVARGIFRLCGKTTGILGGAGAETYRVSAISGGAIEFSNREKCVRIESQHKLTTRPTIVCDTDRFGIRKCGKTNKKRRGLPENARKCRKTHKIPPPDAGEFYRSEMCSRPTFPDIRTLH